LCGYFLGEKGVFPNGEGLKKRKGWLVNAIWLLSVFFGAYLEMGRKSFCVWEKAEKV